MEKEPREPSQQKKKKQPIDYARYSVMGFQMAAIMFIGTYAGVKLDQRIHLKIPAFTILFSLLSVFAAMYFVVKDLLKK